MIQYIQTENCEATELDGEWMILNSNQLTITKLNDVGGHCWSLLEQKQTAQTLTQSLLEKFPANDITEVKQDIEEFLMNLMEYGLVQHAN